MGAYHAGRHGATTSLALLLDRFANVSIDQKRSAWVRLEVDCKKHGGVNE
jgi:hypothetical protein